MKRVALVPSAFHPSLGGVEELTGQLALHYVKKGLEVMVLTNRWPRNLPAEEQWRGVPLMRFPFRLPESGLKSRLSSVLTRRQICRRFVQTLEKFQPDVVHVQCVSSNSWYASAAANALDVPLVVTAQGELTMDANGLYRTSPLYNRLLQNVVGSAQKVTGCSRSTLREVETFFGTPLQQRGTVIHNGVGLESFQTGPSWVHKAPYFFGIGRIVPQKGFYELIQAYARSGIVKTHLLLAGDGPDMARLCALRSELGLCGRVHFLGRAGRPAVHALMRGARGIAVPSLREPFGIVSLEAMAAGKALLASHVGGIPEVVPQSKGVRLVPPGNVEALAEGLRWLETGVDGDCSEALRRHALRFLWPRIAERYLSAYREAKAAA
jgi:glycosyltransferase involved in cell wall biosynthesis